MLISLCKGVRQQWFYHLENCTLASTSIIHWITVTLKSAQRRFCWLSWTDSWIKKSKLRWEPLSSAFSYFFFFYHPSSFFSPGKVAIQSSLERKINSLVIHKNVNATSVPLGTSVCAVWDHSGLSMWLWTCDKWPHCFWYSILCQICYVHLNKYLCNIYMKANHTHTHKMRTHSLLTCPHTSSAVDLSCVMETGVRYCVMCVGVISLGKRTKDLTEAAREPTITAWNITAVNEAALWQEGSWAPVSDSTHIRTSSAGTKMGGIVNS